jgi:ADP-heptose:LPS heptosyltransferase
LNSAPDSPPASDAPLRLLFVKLKHIGDALLLTPTLVAVQRAYPNAQNCVVVREGTEGILAGCPAIHRLVTVAGVEGEHRARGGGWSVARRADLARAAEGAV